MNRKLTSGHLLLAMVGGALLGLARSAPSTYVISGRDDDTFIPPRMLQKKNEGRMPHVGKPPFRVRKRKGARGK